MVRSSSGNRAGYERWQKGGAHRPWVSPSEGMSSLGRQLPEKGRASAEQNSPELCRLQMGAPTSWGAHHVHVTLALHCVVNPWGAVLGVFCRRGGGQLGLYPVTGGPRGGPAHERSGRRGVP